MTIAGPKRSRHVAVAWASLVATTMLLPCDDAIARVPCVGHQLLPIPRPASSCRTLRPAAFLSPDGGLTALVVPADPSLHATPDMESRVDIKAESGKAKGGKTPGRRTQAGQTRASKDYSSPGGANGYYVVQAKWTPDSQYFVFSLASSGGHSPWQSPMAVYSRAGNVFVSFSDVIGGEPTLSSTFKLVGAHSVVATTWRDQNFEKPRTVTVNLKDAISKRPPPP